MFFSCLVLSLLLLRLEFLLLPLTVSTSSPSVFLAPLEKRKKWYSVKPTQQQQHVFLSRLTMQDRCPDDCPNPSPK
jgi:hypothetical protein